MFWGLVKGHGMVLGKFVVCLRKRATQRGPPRFGQPGGGFFCQALEGIKKGGFYGRYRGKGGRERGGQQGGDPCGGGKRLVGRISFTRKKGGGPNLFQKTKTSGFGGGGGGTVPF